jgi:hypothetical protein
MTVQEIAPEARGKITLISANSPGSVSTSIDAHDVGIGYIEQSSGCRCNGIQHRLDLGWRGGDDTQHFRSRAQLLQHLVPLTCEQRNPLGCNGGTNVRLWRIAGTSISMAHRSILPQNIFEATIRNYHITAERPPITAISNRVYAKG